MKHIAILGFGCAGYHCARTLREEGYTGELHVFSDTDLPPYNPMLTTYYAGGRLPREGMFPFGGREEIVSSLDLIFHGGRAVKHLDAGRREITLANGEKHGFDAALIATGAQVFRPRLAHIPEKNVYGIRTPEDAEALRRRMGEGAIRHAVVVGASMVGIKAAELFQRAGIPCVLADLASGLFPLAAVPEVAAELKKRIEEKGVALKLGAGLTAIEETGDGLLVSFGEERVFTDLVVLALGTRPNLDFLDEDGPRVDKGILINERMETSVPDIYAAGDCASGRNIQTGRNQTIGLWANAGFQGDTAARAMLGKEAAYPGTMPHNITHFMDMDFIGFGDVAAEGEIIRYRKEDFFLYAVRREGKLALVNIVDNESISGVIKSFMTRRFLGVDEPLGPMQKAVLLCNGLDNDIIALLEHTKPEGGGLYG